MYAHHKRLFNIGRTAGASCKRHQRRQLLIVFFFQCHQSIPDIIDQLIGIGNANMDGGIDTDCATTGAGRTKDNAAGTGNQTFTAGDGCITVSQLGGGEAVKSMCFQDSTDLFFTAI